MAEIRIDSKVELRKISEIKPYVRNPRKNAKTVELLCKVIPKVGFNVPLVIDENGVIIKGHARFAAAIRLGMTELPCIVSHADPEAIKADRITDNKISEFSEWVNEDLMHELDTLDFGIDLSDFGLPSVSLDDMPAFEPEPEDAPADAPMDEETRQRLYEAFLARQAQEAQDSPMTTPEALERAKEAQSRTAGAPPRYYKCVCEKCGHIMFVQEGNICDRMED